MFLRAVNRERHGDPPTHTHLAADYEVSIDDPSLIMTFDVAHGTKQDKIELSRDTGLMGMTISHHGSIEELAFLCHAPDCSLVRSEGIRTPIERRIVDRTRKRASGGKFREDWTPPEDLTHVLSQREIIPQVRLYRGTDGQLSVTPHVQVEVSAGSGPLPAIGTELPAVLSGPNGERDEMQIKVVALTTGRNGAPAADVVIEGRAASVVHAQLLAAFRGETGALV